MSIVVSTTSGVNHLNTHAKSKMWYHAEQKHEQTKGTRSVLVITKGKIAALTIYTLDEIAAWPAASITVHPGGFWTGTIAYEGKETADGRLIEDEALTWDKTAMPMTLTTIIDEFRNRRAVGEIHEIQRRDYGTIRSNGVSELPPGDYACGIDLTDMKYHITEDKTESP